MSAPIGPGDWVECIKTAPGTRIFLGKVFQVEAVLGEWPCIMGHSKCTGLIFVGLPRSTHSSGGYAACGFRPIHPGGELIRLLTETPVITTIEALEPA